MSAGMAYEAMNNAGAMHSRLIIILNDNDMSIAPPAGALSPIWPGSFPAAPIARVREAAKQLGSASAEVHLRPCPQDRGIRPRNFWAGGTMFEELGFYYVGPIDGHNLDHLLPVLKNVRDSEGGARSSCMS